MTYPRAQARREHECCCGTGLLDPSLFVATRKPARGIACIAQTTTVGPDTPIKDVGAL